MAIRIQITGSGTVGGTIGPDGYTVITTGAAIVSTQFTNEGDNLDVLNNRLQTMRDKGSESLLSHRNYSKGGLVLHLCDTMKLPHPIDIKERTKPWDIIAQFSRKSCG
jgi:hypothetical protein